MITIDDELLLDMRTYNYYKARSQKALWAPLLSKAWAKVVGNYGRTAGTNEEAQEMLTGAPTFVKRMASFVGDDGHKRLAEYLQEVKDSGFIMSAKSFTQDNQYTM